MTWPCSDFSAPVHSILDSTAMAGRCATDRFLLTMIIGWLGPSEGLLSPRSVLSGLLIPTSSQVGRPLMDQLLNMVLICYPQVRAPLRGMRVLNSRQGDQTLSASTFL